MAAPPDLAVNAVASNNVLSLGTTAWLAVLTLILFVMMAVSAHRWRQQRRRRRLQDTEDDVTSSRAPDDDVSMSDVASVVVDSELGGSTGKDTAAASTPSTCHINSAFPAQELRTHHQPDGTRC